MLINGRFLTRPATGVDRFAIELLRASAAASPGMAWHALVPGATTPAVPWPGDTQTRPVGRLNGHAWEQFELPRFAADRPLVNLCNTGPVIRERQLVVLHDAGAVANPANYSRAFRAWYRPMMAALMRRSRVVATVSNFSADELMRHFGRSQHRKLEVFVEGGEHIRRCAPDEGVIDRNGLRGRRFVLAVGSRSANKNFASVVRAVNALQDPDVLLVAAGGGDSRVFTSTDVQDARLRYTGYVSDGELRALYQHAMCFAFPSFYEGFGLPPLEAMCCGCPVIVSDRASLPEVCGDAALYCNPDDPSTLTQQLQRLIASAPLRAELREAGFAQAAVFGWDKAARQFAQLMGEHFPESDEAQRFSSLVRQSPSVHADLSAARS